MLIPAQANITILNDDGMLLPIRKCLLLESE
jgi:hypothetical protein